MSRRQPDGFLNVFIFSFQKDPSRENPSVLVQDETACPARNTGRGDESMGAGKLKRAQLGYPHQTCKVMLPYRARESPAFLPMCVVQNKQA